MDFKTFIVCSILFTFAYIAVSWSDDNYTVENEILESTCSIDSNEPFIVTDYKVSKVFRSWYEIGEERSYTNKDITCETILLRVEVEEIHEDGLSTTIKGWFN